MIGYLSIAVLSSDFLRLLLRLDQGVYTLTAISKVLEVTNSTLGDLGQGLLGKESLVAVDDDIRESHKTYKLIVVDDIAAIIVVKQGSLSLVHVQGQAGELVCLKGLNNGTGIDETATRRIDHNGTRLE